jgi:hypothetical protein
MEIEEETSIVGHSSFAEIGEHPTRLHSLGAMGSTPPRNAREIILEGVTT